VSGIVAPSIKVVMYARVSSKDQEREGFSIPAQQKLLREYAEQNGLTIAREFLDVETAKQTGRPGFGAMLEYLRSEPSCRTILVEKTDRLYRNFADVVALEELSPTINFVKENTVLWKGSRSSEKLVHGFKVLIAKNYSDNLSEEVRKGMREKAEQGHWPSVAPVGYVNNLATHQIEIDPVRGPLVTALFELYATGEYSVKGIVSRAREIGLTSSRSSCPMKKAQIHRLLQNPLYVGDFRWNGRVLGGRHVPLVSRILFQQVQDILGRKPRARLPKQKHPFMGLLRCARCGCTITAERKKGKYVYYRCTAFHGSCGNQYIREERLADLLGTLVERIEIPQEIAGWITERISVEQRSMDRSRRESLTMIRHRLSGLQAKLDRAYEDYLEGRISQAFWERKSAEWEQEQTTMNVEVERLSRPLPTIEISAARTLELAKGAHSRYLAQPYPERRRLLDAVLSNCSFDRGTLCPDWRKPFDLFVQGNETGDWRGGRDSNPRPPA
jgi:site-specific DNA recombinase